MIRTLLTTLAAVAVVFALSAPVRAYSGEIAELEESLEALGTLLDRCKNMTAFLDTGVKSLEGALEKAGDQVSPADRENLEAGLKRLKQRRDEYSGCVKNLRDLIRKQARRLDQLRKNVMAEADEAEPGRKPKPGGDKDDESGQAEDRGHGSSGGERSERSDVDQALATLDYFKGLLDGAEAEAGELLSVEEAVDRQIDRFEQHIFSLR